MIPVDKQMQLIKRGATNLIDEGELRKKLERGKPPPISIWAIRSLSTSCATFRNSATASSSSSATSPDASATLPAVPPPARP